MECGTCHGMRFVSVEAPKYWKQSGVRAAIGTQWVSEMCPDCDGTGLAVDPARNPDCHQCDGRGQRNAFASSGEWETEDCTCTNPARRNAIENDILGMGQPVWSVRDAALNMLCVFGVFAVVVLSAVL